MLRFSLEELNTFARNFSEMSFWKKMQMHAGRAGRELVEKAMTLYYLLQKPDLPPWVRSVVVGALGYFLWPMDTFPDFAPGIGFTDDLAVLGTVLTSITLHVDEDIRTRAQLKAHDWLG